MIEITVDSRLSLLTLRLSRRVVVDDLRRAAPRVEARLGQLPSGFRLLTDLSQLEAMDLDCAPEVERMMDLFNKQGVGTVVRIIPEPHQDIGFNIMSLFHYQPQVRIVTCTTTAEAEAILREMPPLPLPDSPGGDEGFRLEADSMGQMRVPSGAYYGAQTARAVDNFPVSGLRFPRSFIRALGLIKKHAAAVNEALGLLPPSVSAAIQSAAEEVVQGKLDTQFVVDIFQTGSGTSTNMNANEVIANRAAELLGGRRGDKSIHPNDQVNCGQSSNDVIPSAIHIAALETLCQGLIPALEELHKALVEKSREFWNILKIGRTHLQDATPMRLGQEFGGYAAQVEHALQGLRLLEPELASLALGGTAVGTGINTHPEFARRTIERIGQETHLPLREAQNHFSAQASIDVCVQASGALKGLALCLAKIANDIRWLGSGPRCGLGEIRLPATQPGSSIMPGKVNPVICEMVMQVAAQVVGNEATIAFASTLGVFELNTALPVTAFNLLQSIELLSNATRIFARRCVAGLAADVQKCVGNLERSLSMVTALAPVIGYDRAAEIAKQAHESGRTVREVAQEMSGLDPSRLAELLDAENQI